MMTYAEMLRSLAIHIFVIQVLFFIACLWFLTKLEYFRNLLIGLTVFSVLIVGGIAVLSHYSPPNSLPSPRENKPRKPENQKT